MSTIVVPPPSAADISQLEYWISFTLQVYSVFVGILCWDWLIQLRQEIRLIWKAQHTLITYLYLFNRYFSLLSNIAITLAYNIHVTTDTCNKYCKLEPALEVFIVLAYQSILVMRMYAVHNKNRYLLIGSIALLMGECAYLLYVSSQLSALPYPAPKGPCIINGSHELITSYFYVPMIVDILITAVTFYQVFILKTRSPNSTVLQLFIREGLVFFAIVCTCNLVNLILYAQPNANVSTIFAGASFVLSSLMSSRLVLSLRSGNFGQENTQSPFGQTSTHVPAVRTLAGPETDQSSTVNLNEKMGRSKNDEDEISLNELEGGHFANGITVSKDTAVHYGQA